MLGRPASTWRAAWDGKRWPLQIAPCGLIGGCIGWISYKARGPYRCSKARPGSFAQASAQTLKARYDASDRRYIGYSRPRREYLSRFPPEGMGKSCVENYHSIWPLWIPILNRTLSFASPYIFSILNQRLIYPMQGLPPQYPPQQPPPQQSSTQQPQASTSGRKCAEVCMDLLAMESVRLFASQGPEAGGPPAAASLEAIGIRVGKQLAER